VARLEKAWKAVPSSSLIKIKQIEELMSSRENYKNYRELLEGTEKPAILYLGLLLRDLVYAEEMYTFSDDDAYVNWGKMREVYRIVSSLLACQRVPYEVEKCPATLNFFQNLRHKRTILNEETLYESDAESSPLERRRSTAPSADTIGLVAPSIHDLRESYQKTLRYMSDAIHSLNHKTMSKQQLKRAITILNTFIQNIDITSTEPATISLFKKPKNPPKDAFDLTHLIHSIITTYPHPNLHLHLKPINLYNHEHIIELILTTLLIAFSTRGPDTPLTIQTTQKNDCTHIIFLDYSPSDFSQALPPTTGDPVSLASILQLFPSIFLVYRIVREMDGRLECNTEADHMILAFILPISKPEQKSGIPNTTRIIERGEKVEWIDEPRTLLLPPRSNTDTKRMSQGHEARSRMLVTSPRGIGPVERTFDPLGRLEKEESEGKGKSRFDPLQRLQNQV